MAYSPVSLSAALRGDNVSVCADQIAQLAESVAINGGALNKSREAVADAGAYCVTIKGKKTGKYALADAAHHALAAIEPAAADHPARDKGADMGTRKAAAMAFGQQCAEAFRADHAARIASLKAEKAAKPAKKAEKADESTRESIEATTPPVMVADGATPVETDRQRAARYLKDLRTTRHALARMTALYSATQQAHEAPATKRKGLKAA